MLMEFYTMDQQTTWMRINVGIQITGANSTFAIGGVSCSTESFVLAESSVIRINICAEKPVHRKSAKRYGAF